MRNSSTDISSRFPYKKVVLLSITWLVFGLFNAVADIHDQACKRYAQEAVRQNKENLKLGAGFSGPAWSNDFDAHYRWCKHGENISSTPTHLFEREKELQLFAIKHGKKPAKRYADHAVRQYHVSVQLKTNFTPPVWSSNHENHQAWAKHGQNIQFTPDELAKRERELQLWVIKYGARQTPIEQDNQSQRKQRYKIVTAQKVATENAETTANDNQMEINPSVLAALAQENEQAKQNFKMMEMDPSVIASTTAHSENQPSMILNINPEIMRYVVGKNLRKGSTVYTDRNFLYWDVPTHLKGLPYLMTNNSDKFSKGNHFFDFKHTKQITVYVAFHVDQKIPAWLIQQGYEKTYETLKIWFPDNDRKLDFSIYKKAFKNGGNLVFGGNLNQNDNTNGLMYTVMFDIEELETRIPINGVGNDSNTVNGWATVNVKRENERSKTSEDQLKSVEQGSVNKDVASNKVCSTQTRRLKASSDTELFFLNDNRNHVLFPGNILHIADIESGNYVSSKTPTRKPYRISTNINGIKSASAIVAKEATIHEFRDAKSHLLNSTNFPNKMGARTKLGKFHSTSSEVDFAIKVTGDLSTLFHSGNASFKYNETNKKYRYVFDITKIYYDIDFTPEQGFFESPHVPIKSDWLYVSKVRYGTKLLLNVESNYSLKKVEAAIKYRFNAGVVSGGGAIETEHRKVVQDMKISVISLGEQSNKYLDNLAKDKYKDAFIDAFKYDNITANTQLMPLSYTLRFMEDNKPATIETYAEYKQLHCGKLREIVRFELMDIIVVNDDDGDGEDLYGWLNMDVPGFGKKELFGHEKDFPDDVGSNQAITFNNNYIYYFKFDQNVINHPDSNIIIETHFREDDDFGDDDFGHRLKKISLKKLVSGEIDETDTEEYVLRKVLNASNHPYMDPDCRVIEFRHDDSKVLLRYKLDLLDTLPSGVKLGF